MIKIAICDDDPKDLLAMSNFVEEYIDSNLSEYAISYSAFRNGTDLLAAIEKGEIFDIFILDIVMPLINGLALAEEIRSTNTVSKIIFLTTSSEYAVDSYKVDAFYYMLKPINKEILLVQLKRARDEIYEDRHKHIIIKRGSGLIKVLISDIEYAEIVEHTIQFYLKDGSVLRRVGTMMQLETELLSDKRFVKPHRSYILNMDCIRSLSPKGISLIQGAHVPISRNMYKEVKQAYIDYLFNQSKN